MKDERIIRLCNLVYGDCEHEREKDIEKYCKKCKHAYEVEVSEEEYAEWKELTE
jgi:hypothetical protein